MKTKQKSNKKVRVLDINEYGHAKILSISETENSGRKIIFSFKKHGELCLGVLISHSFFDKDQVKEWVALTKRFLTFATGEEISQRIVDAEYMESTMSVLIGGEENEVA